MLKYSIRVTDKDIENNTLEWREKYLAPDLSYISGVTDVSSHIERFNELSAHNSLSNQGSILSLETENVTRTGYIIIKDKEYKVETINDIDYVFINGKYFYENNSGITVTNWQCETINGIIEKDVKRPIESATTTTYEEFEAPYEFDGEICADAQPIFNNEERKLLIDCTDEGDTEKSYSELNIPDDCTVSDISIDITNKVLTLKYRKKETKVDYTYIALDTVCWIEDGLVEIDGVKYIFDKNEQQEDGTIGCLKLFEDGSVINETDITKCSSIYYAPYTSVKEIHDVCKFKLTKPTYKTIEYNYVKPCEYFFYVDYKNNYYPIRVSGDTNVVCEISPSNDEFVYSTELDSGGTQQQVTISGDIKDLNDLVNIASYVDIEGVQYNTQYDYRVSNSSRLIMVDIKDQHSSLNIGDKITFEDSSEDELNLTISSADTSVLYDGKKYPIKDKLVSKAVIDGNEYDIEYPRYSSEFAYVIIDGEQVPMEIVEVDEEKRLSRYGLVVNSSNGAAAQETYSINSYSGVTIDGRDYMIKDTNGITMVMIEKKDRIRFVVDDIKGNSLLICEPYINTNEYTSDEIKERQKELCDKIVNNQSNYSLLLPNPIFGLMPITNDLAFTVTSTPKSSDDYYDLFNDLVIETNSGYINLPINISTNVTNNLLQSELVQEDFCEKEKEKAINPIVDLEKDVYTPKYLVDTTYNGKDSTFNPIYKINFNLHFRTRDLTSWKVNESYNDVSTSGKTDNWFVTDYYPYSTIIKDGATSAKTTLMETSDLVGLLYYTNTDVFYQKSNLAKSFLRLSFYDSTDPQKQSLLATSTVFVNEHELYKKFIDNSKKNVHEYYTVGETQGDCKTINKINVSSERETSKGDNGKYVVKISDNLHLDLDNDKRLSSRISVVNKYDTTSSSEGFYIYMFREYSKKLHPKPIYMKVEYNHAGIGKTIPFIIPMKWSSYDSNTAVIDIQDRFKEDTTTTTTNAATPESALTFNNSDDLSKLKEGVPLEYLYAQSYIPLYAVYDFKNKEYAYTFDERYVKIINGIANLNLFEIKIKSDTVTQESTTTQNGDTSSSTENQGEGTNTQNDDNNEGNEGENNSGNNNGGSNHELINDNDDVEPLVPKPGLNPKPNLPGGDQIIIDNDENNP